MKSLHMWQVHQAPYRKELNRYYSDPENYRFDPNSMSELKASHRPFTTGFFLENLAAILNNMKAKYIGGDFVAIMLET